MSAAISAQLRYRNLDVFSTAMLISQGAAETTDDFVGIMQPTLASVCLYSHSQFAAVQIRARGCIMSVYK